MIILSHSCLIACSELSMLVILLNVKIETGHFMTVWMVGRDVYCYIYICRFSVDAQFNLIMLPLDGEVKTDSDVIFFLGYFEF